MIDLFWQRIKEQEILALQDNLLFSLFQFLHDSKTLGKESLLKFLNEANVDKYSAVTLLPILIYFSSLLEPSSLKEKLEEVILHLRVQVQTLEASSPAKILIKALLLENKVPETLELSLCSTDFIGELMALSLFLGMSNFGSFFWDKDYQIYKGPELSESYFEYQQRANLFQFYHTGNAKRLLLEGTLSDLLLAGCTHAILPNNPQEINVKNWHEKKEESYLMSFYCQEKEPMESLWKKAHPMVCFFKSEKTPLSLQGRGMQILSFHQEDQKITFKIKLNSRLCEEAPESRSEFFSLFLPKKETFQIMIENERFTTAFDLKKPLIIKNKDVEIRVSIKLEGHAMGHIQPGKRFSETADTNPQDWQIFFRTLAPLTNPTLQLTFDFDEVK